MRLAFFALGLLISGFVWADPEEPPPQEPPLVLEHGLWEQFTEADQAVWKWSVVVVGGAAGVGMAFWGLGSALAHLSDPGGPPLGATVTGLVWSTLGLAAAGVALDELLTSP